MKIGDRLVRAGRITRDQLGEALEHQVLQGGRLGTCLAELELLSLDDLADELGRQHSMPAAHEHHFETADRCLQACLEPEIAVLFQAVPLRRRPAGTAQVAFLDPPSPEVLQAVADALHQDVEAWIAPELRILYQLEEVYGAPRPARFLRPEARPANLVTPEGSHARHYVEPLKGEALGRIPIARKVVRREPPVEAAPPRSYEDTFVAIRQAQRQSTIIGPLVEFLEGGRGLELEVGALFLIRKKVAVGWRGFCPAGNQALLSVAIALDEPSLLKLAYDTGVVVCGKPPPAGAAVDHQLWYLLGSDAPSELVVAPIRVRRRVVLLLYAHRKGGQGVPGRIVNQLSELADAAGRELERLLDEAGSRAA